MTALVYLFGYPGIGKNTIAREMEKQSDLIAIQNHLLSNAFRHVAHRQEAKRYHEIEPALRHHTMKAWLNFLQFVDSAVPQQGMIFTSVLYQDDPDRVQFFDFIRSWAAQQKRHFLPVRLMCDQEEALRRVASGSRKSEFKLTDTDVIRELMHKHQVMKPEGCFELDVTQLSAADAAQTILARLPA